MFRLSQQWQVNEAGVCLWNGKQSATPWIVLPKYDAVPARVFPMIIEKIASAIRIVSKIAANARRRRPKSCPD
jgi:hypothetical protein